MLTSEGACGEDGLLVVPVVYVESRLIATLGDISSGGCWSGYGDALAFVDVPCCCGVDREPMCRIAAVTLSLVTLLATARACFGSGGI